MAALGSLEVEQCNLSAINSSAIQSLFLALIAGRAALAAQPPNIVFIFSDDHAYQAVSAYGFGLNKTPNIDRIAAEGMRFDRCLTTNSICGPSRACLLTGKYSHMNDFYNNTNSRFDGSQTTFPKLLQKAGYQTAIIGKWHLETDPTGFDFWEILPGQGQYYNPPMIHNGQQVKKTGYVTDIITDRLPRLAASKRDKSKPFLLMCQHKAPHREWEPALVAPGRLRRREVSRAADALRRLLRPRQGRARAGHDDRQDADAARPQADAAADIERRAAQGWDAYYDPRNDAFREQNLSRQRPGPLEVPARTCTIIWRRSRRSTKASASCSIISTRRAWPKNTIVVYSSDQGFFLGEHGWFDKRWIFEESLRTPLLVRWPGVVKPGSTNADIVSNLDFAETLLGRRRRRQCPRKCRAAASCRSSRAKRRPTGAKAFYYHYYEHPGPHNVAKHYGVITDRYKLVHFYEPEINYWELFDLKTDPHELRSVYDDPNLFGGPQVTCTGCLERLRTEYERTG